MVVYFTMLFLTVAFAFMAVYYKNDYCLQINSMAKSIVIKRKNIFAFLSFLSICITSALRYNVGVDFHSYYWMYSVIANGDKIHAEKGYRFLNELLINFTSEPQAIFVVTSIIITGLFFYGCFKYSPKPAMSLFLFITMGYLFSSFNILRQYIAIALIFASLKLIKENKFLPFLLIILVAMTFHKTAIIMIPLFFLTRLRLKQSYMVVISIICACFVPLRGVLTNILVKIFYPQYAGTNLIQPLSKFEFIYYALVFGTVVLLCFAYKKTFFKDTYNLILFNCVFYSFLIYTCFSFVPEINRIAIYIEIFVIVLIPKIFELEQNKKVKRLYYACAIIFFLLFFIVSVGVMGRYGVLPYQTFFSK